MPIHTVTIGAGDSTWVPKTAKLLSVDATGGLTLSGGDCIDTSVDARLCYKLSYTYTQDGGTTGAWDAGDANNKIIGVYINGSEKPCSYEIVDGLSSLMTFITTQSGGSIISSAFTLSDGDPSDKDTVNITFSAPKAVGDSLYFKFQITQAVGDPLTNIRIYAEEIGCGV